MSKNTDTRALTREAYPHILKAGDNASVAGVKEWVREHRCMPDWNPSATTIQDELRKIRQENGAALLEGIRFPTVEPLLAEVTGEYFQKIHQLLREVATSDFDEARRKQEQLVVAAKVSVQKAHDQVVSIQADLSLARQEFERREIKFTADIEHQADTINDLRQALQELGTVNAASEARNIELARQVERITAERTAEAIRHNSQLQLADERYRELEKAKLMELDNTRTQRDRIQAELEKLKGELTEMRFQLGVKSVEAAEVRGETKALRERIAELTERVDSEVTSNNQLRIDNNTLLQSRNAAEESAKILGQQVSDQEIRLTSLQGLLSALPAGDKAVRTSQEQAESQPAQRAVGS